MSNWNETTLNDVCSVLGDGLHGTPQYSEDGEYAFVNGNNLVNGKIVIKKDTKKVDRSQYEKYKKPLTTKTILVSINGTLGNVAIYSGEKIILGKSACYFNVKEEYDADYIRYVVSTPVFKSYLENNATGTTIKNVSLKQMREYRFLIPELETQRKIARVLKLIDDKIENNNRINRNLQELLDAVYSEMFSSEINGILSDICDYSKERIDVSEITEKAYYSTENMLPEKKGAIFASGLPSTEKTPKCLPGNTLISNIRPYFKKIVYCHEVAGCSSDVLCFVSKKNDLSQYLFSTLYSDEFFEYMIAGSKGTKMPRGDKQQIMRYAIHIPTEAELEKFNGLAKKILESIHKNTIENQRLEMLRGSILPQLMSGEVDVSDIEI